MDVPEPTRVRRCALVLASSALTLSAACSTGQQTASSGGCPAAVAAVSSQDVTRGQSVEVTGTYFFDSCHDVGHDTGRRPAARPLTRLAVTFVQGGTVVELGRTDAGGDVASVRTAVFVPTGASAGPAQITLGRARAVEIRVVG